MPKVAIAPLLLIWFGYGLMPKVLVAFLVAFFPIVVNGASGLAGVSARTAGPRPLASGEPLADILEVQIPTALPELFSGMKIAVTLAIIGAIIGEFVGGNRRPRLSHHRRQPGARHRARLCRNLSALGNGHPALRL